MIHTASHTSPSGASPVHFLLVLASLACLAAPGVAQTTEQVSVDSAGANANGSSWKPAISADGRFVAYWSEATNLVRYDTNGWDDVFVHDRQTGETTRASLDSAGVQGNDHSWDPSISRDGRFVAFVSEATNLIPSGTNGLKQVFVRDLQTRRTALVSVDSAGVGGDEVSDRPSISACGRFVAFDSLATNLVSSDTNGNRDVFVHDLQTGQTSLVSVDSGGAQGNDWSRGASISADGRFVAFNSMASNLVPGDANGWHDVFVHDLGSGQTTRVSVGSAGAEGNGWSDEPSISADGRFVAFDSMASNLVPGDTNSAWDVFVHDRLTGQTTRVSIDSAGLQGNRESYQTSISADGRFVAFQSLATNLVFGDTNGNGRDVFVHDRQTGETVRMSVNSAGVEGNSSSWTPSISSDGRCVAFASWAYNLVPGPTNGRHNVFVRDMGGGGPWLAVHSLVAGGTATLEVIGATAGGIVRPAYSLVGGGPINTPYGRLLLSQPLRALPAMTANASGGASLPILVPPGATGVSIWFHTFDVGSLTFSNGVATAIG